MKITTLSNLTTFGGLGIFLVLAFAGWTLLNISEEIVMKDPILSGILFALGGILILSGMAFMLLLWNLGDGQNITHHKRILQKHGLWQDEMIRKKDLAPNSTPDKDDTKNAN